MKLKFDFDFTIKPIYDLEINEKWFSIIQKSIIGSILIVMFVGWFY